MDEKESDLVNEAFEKLCSTLDLATTGYEIAACKKFVNDLVPPEDGISRKVLKKMLDNRYGIIFLSLGPR